MPSIASILKTVDLDLSFAVDHFEADDTPAISSTVDALTALRTSGLADAQRAAHEAGRLARTPVVRDALFAAALGIETVLLMLAEEDAARS